MNIQYLTIIEQPLASDQRGGALVESILIIGVLLVFMVGVPMIGSMIDLKQTTIQASRYSAWEKTVHVETDGTAAQIDHRFFRDASAPITTALSADIAPNALWGELTESNSRTESVDNASNAETGAGDSELQLFQKARVTLLPGSVTVSNEYKGRNNSSAVFEDDRIYRGVSKVVTTIGRFGSRDGWDEGNPVSDGLVRSNVEATIANNTFLSDQTSFKESTSIFIDGWSASDSEIIRDRVHGFVPTNRLDRVGAFISVVKNLPMLNDLKHLEKAFGCVKTNIVPGKEHGDELIRYNPTSGDDC